MKSNLAMARMHKHWTLFQASEKIGVDANTLGRWERGKMKPRGYNLQRLCEVYGMTTEELGLEEEKEGMMISLPSMKVAFLSTDFTTRLLSLAFIPYSNYHDLQTQLTIMIKEYDAMHVDPINRREALRRLAAFPFIALNLEAASSVLLEPIQYSAVITQCAASAEACWKLCQSNDASDLLLAFKCVSKYLPLLKHIVSDSSQYRKQAADLAARYALLKTILGWHCKGLSQAIHYAQSAVNYSEEVGDLSLQLSAYSKLAWAYYYDKKHAFALNTAMQAVAVLEQRQKKDTLPSCIRGGIYSTLAIMQARNGVIADSALGKAMEVDPGNESYAYMEFTRSDLPREAALVYSYQGSQTKALEQLELLIDPTTFAVKLSDSERGRLEVINSMALASLKSSDRDKEKTMRLWTAMIEGAKAFRSEWAFDEAVTTYDLMEVVWPGDAHIKELRELVIHW